MTSHRLHVTRSTSSIAVALCSVTAENSPLSCCACDGVTHDVLFTIYVRLNTAITDCVRLCLPDCLLSTLSKVSEVARILSRYKPTVTERRDHLPPAQMGHIRRNRRPYGTVAVQFLFYFSESVLEPLTVV